MCRRGGVQRVYGQGLLLTPIAPDVWSVFEGGGGVSFITCPPQSHFRLVQTCAKPS